MENEPTGFITVDGETMAYWLPDGVTPEDIGLETEAVEEAGKEAA